MLLLQQKRRQETQHRVLCAVEEHTLRQRLFHNRTRRNLKLESLNETSSADVLSRGIAFRQSFQLLLQVRSYTGDILQQPFFFEDRQIFEGNAAGQRAATERGSMLDSGHRRRQLFFRQESAQRQPGRDRFGDSHDVRRHAESLEREDCAGAAQPALDLIEDQRGAMAVGECPAFLQKLDGHSWMPPSPKIGSSTMAQVLSSTAALSAWMSFRGTNFTSSRSGSNPLRYLSCPVSDMAPKVRP